MINNQTVEQKSSPPAMELGGKSNLRTQLYFQSPSYVSHRSAGNTNEYSRSNAIGPCSINMNHVNDWMKAIKTPTQYRVGSSTVTLNKRMCAVIGILFLIILTFLLLIIPAAEYDGSVDQRYMMVRHYNKTYPLSPTLVRADGSLSYSIAMVTDLDEASKSPSEEKTWISYVQLAKLNYNPSSSTIDFVVNQKLFALKSSFSSGGRGMELSELIAFNGKLYTIDDRTGIVYEITMDWNIIPWVILSDGDGNQSKGFKAEWASVKDRTLIIGGLGKEWTNNEQKVIHSNPQWIKSVGHFGDILHHNWTFQYNALRHACGADFPGYLIHESAVWSSVHKLWFFLPRRASALSYDEKLDELRGTNLMITANSDFKDIQVEKVGNLNPARGFSSFKFIPNTNDNLIVALKSEENGENIATYITVFSVDGVVIMEETFIGNYKFEGLEFI